MGAFQAPWAVFAAAVFAPRMPTAVSLKTASSANTTNTWVQLLDNFEYYGERMPSYATPMNYGSFTQLKAVYQSGSGIYCDTKRSGGTVWQQCCCGYNSFEAMKNGGYIVSQPNWYTLPSNCYSSGSTEIICNVNFDISSGDTILATWYEPSRSSSLGDNGGSIQVDLYGYGTGADPTVFPTAFPTPYPTAFPTPFPTHFPTAFPTPFPTPSPTPSPTYPPGWPTPHPTFLPAAPAAAGAGGGVAATGDPHLQNVHGERFDLMKQGMHVLINIPRGMSAEDSLLHVQADARRVGGSCADMYFQEVNVTGFWAEDKQVGGYHHSVSQIVVEAPQWVAFGSVQLKVSHGRTDSGVQYLNVYVKRLGLAGFAVGGLLGEDDHKDVMTPPVACIKHTSLSVGGAIGQASSSVSSVALATFE